MELARPQEGAGGAGQGLAGGEGGDRERGREQGVIVCVCGSSGGISWGGGVGEAATECWGEEEIGTPGD